MKNLIKTLSITLILFSLSIAQAASFVVWPGQSLQAAIDAAAAGDNITVQTGTYDENITITKGIDIRGTGGAVLVTGTLSVNNAVLPVYISDITWGKTGASGITLTGDGTQNVRMDRCKLVGGGDLNSTGTVGYFYKSTFANDVNFYSSTWTFQRCTVTQHLLSSNSIAKFIASEVNSNLTHNGDGGPAGEITVFQSYVGERTDITLPNNTQGWIAYSTLRYPEFKGGIVTIVGNRFDGRDTGNTFLNISNGCEAMISNNFFYNDNRRIDNFNNIFINGSTAIQIHGTAGLVRIFNNTASDVWRFVSVSGSPTGVEVRGNIHTNVNGSYRLQPAISVETSFLGTIISDNNFYVITGGTQSNNINADPKFTTGPNGETYWLGTTSPSIDAGPSDALYNDIDGSRNDQGAYGGHSYDPTGRTTLKPVVLSGEVSPLYIKRGGAVTIKARAAVSAAP